MNLKTIATCFFLILFISAIAQNGPTYKFGKVDPKEFERRVYSIDSNASAVVLADIGSTEIIGNNKSWFSVSFKRYVRIHILKKAGYDAGNFEIGLYADKGLEEKLDNLKAVTYNLESGQVIETRLDKSAVFKDKIDKNVFVKKFTLPNVKEGSIIECQYEIISDFIQHLQPWSFQGSYPVLWSEYNVSIPQFFSYAFLSQGYWPFYIKDHKDRTQSFTVADSRGTSATERESFTSGITDYRWAMKDVPALKEESYTSTIKNHTSKIEFQLSEFRDPLTYRNIMGTWQDLGKELMDAEFFGSILKRDNNWLGEVLKPLLTGSKTDIEKTRLIYSYVRDNFTCKDHSELYLDQTLKNLLKNKSGSVAEINMLLIAMFRYAGINADPVILSTKSHGYTYPLYPLISRFNYVIAKAVVEGKNCYFDASVPSLGFNKLMPYCYNGVARIIDENVNAVDFNPDSLKETKLSSVVLNNDENGNLDGFMQQNVGYFESLDIRDKIKEKGKDEFFKEIKKEYGDDAELKNLVLDSLNNLEEPVKISYEFALKQSNSNIIYFDPMFGEGVKKNPFQSAERYYPVEMPFTTDETYVMNMEVPKGYTIDELPKSLRVKLNEDGDGYFEYLIQADGERISMRSRLKLKRTYFKPEEYDMLREFFNVIVKKHNEQIVFKRKTN